MPSDSVRITVVGAGGLGGYFGGLLGRAGHHLTFIARGAHLRALREQGGLNLKTVHGDFFIPAEAREAATSDAPADLVLFTVKSYDTAEAAERLAPAVGEQTAILSLQNGVDNEEVLARLYGSERVLGGTAYILSTIEEPGTVRQSAGPRRIVFGEWRGGMTPRVAAWDRRLHEAEINATVSEDIVREKWVKFAFIVAHSGMTALTQGPIGPIRDTPATWEMFRQMIEEVVAVGRARGVRLGPEVVEEHMAFASRLEPTMGSSLLHDLSQGNRLELEALQGTVVRYGRDAEVSTPMCAAVYALLLPFALGRA